MHNCDDNLEGGEKKYNPSDHWLVRIYVLNPLNVFILNK